MSKAAPMSRTVKPRSRSSFAATRTSWAARCLVRSDSCRRAWERSRHSDLVGQLNGHLQDEGLRVDFLHDGDEVAGHGFDLPEIAGLGVVVDLRDVHQPEHITPDHPCVVRRHFHHRFPNFAVEDGSVGLFSQAGVGSSR